MAGLKGKRYKEAVVLVIEIVRFGGFVRERVFSMISFFGHIYKHESIN